LFDFRRGGCAGEVEEFVEVLAEVMGCGHGAPVSGGRRELPRRLVSW
jgi:hypothetical protein